MSGRWLGDMPFDIRGAEEADRRNGTDRQPPGWPLRPGQGGATAERRLLATGPGREADAGAPA